VVKGGGAPVEAPQDLEGLSLQLVFLAANEGDDIVDYVHGTDPGIAGPTDGLHCGHHHGLHTIGLVNGLEGHDQARGGTVGVADQETLLEAPLGALEGNDVEVLRVHHGDHQGHILCHSVVLGVAEHREILRHKGALWETKRGSTKEKA